jgi:hypothetical protein
MHMGPSMQTRKTRTGVNLRCDGYSEVAGFYDRICANIHSYEFTEIHVLDIVVDHDSTA